MSADDFSCRALLTPFPHSVSSNALLVTSVATLPRTVPIPGGAGVFVVAGRVVLRERQCDAIGASS